MRPPTKWCQFLTWAVDTAQFNARCQPESSLPVDLPRNLCIHIQVAGGGLEHVSSA